MATIANIAVMLSASTAAFTDGMRKAADRLGQFTSSARKMDDVVGKASNSLYAQNVAANKTSAAWLRGGGAAAGLTYAATRMNGALDKIADIQRKVAAGAFSAEDATAAYRDEIVKAIPVIGGWFEAGQKLGGMLSGQASDIARVTAQMESYNKVLDSVKAGAKAAQDVGDSMSSAKKSIENTGKLGSLSGFPKEREALRQSAAARNAELARGGASAVETINKNEADALKAVNDSAAAVRDAAKAAAKEDAGIKPIDAALASGPLWAAKIKAIEDAAVAKADTSIKQQLAAISGRAESERVKVSSSVRSAQDAADKNNQAALQRIKQSEQRARAESLGGWVGYWVERGVAAVDGVKKQLDAASAAGSEFVRQQAEISAMIADAEGRDLDSRLIQIEEHYRQLKEKASESARAQLEIMEQLELDEAKVKTSNKPVIPPAEPVPTAEGRAAAGGMGGNIDLSRVVLSGIGGGLNKEQKVKDPQLVDTNALLRELIRKNASVGIAG